MAKTKTRKSYSPEQRRQILEAATREGLTAMDVKKKFGVTPVTYYSWRKKSGAAAKRGRGGARVASNGSSDLTAQLRTEVRAKIKAVLPDIVKSEVASYMNALFGSSGKRQRV